MRTLALSLCALLWSAALLLAGPPASVSASCRSPKCEMAPVAFSRAKLAGTLTDQVVTPTVHIDAPDEAFGSGVVIEHAGGVYILTAAHVVADCYAPRMRTRIDGTGKAVSTLDTAPLPVDITTRDRGTVSTRKARVVWYDQAADLALLRPDSPVGLHAAELAPADLEAEPGERALYCGSGGGLKWSLVSTHVNQSDERWLTVNGEGWFGHSGSGVYLRRGKRWLLAGVVSEFAGDPADNPRLPMKAVPVSAIREFLAAYRP